MTEAVIAVPLCELLFIVSALPRSLIVFALPRSAALQRATGAQLLALRIGEAGVALAHVGALLVVQDAPLLGKSEEHTSELQSLMRISYAVFCLTKKKQK